MFVEGPGDIQAAPVLVRRILGELSPWTHLWLDDCPFRIGGIQDITGRRAPEWTKKLTAASRLPNLGGVLVLLDGDRKSVVNDDTRAAEPFCAANVAPRLAERAREAGAGTRFSVACVFACREFESWLLAGAGSLTGKPFPDGRRGVRADPPLPDQDTDLHPRDAKGWFETHMEEGYKATTDQKPLTELVDLAAIRERRPRSFRRLEHAITQLSEAIRTGEHIVSPVA